MRDRDSPERIGYAGAVILADPTDVALWSLAATVAMWWSGTAAVLFAVRARSAKRPAFVLGATILAVCALALLRALGDRVDLLGAVGSFACAVVVWGYVEFLFLTGRVVGPRNASCETECSGWRHAGHALRAILHYEAALVGAALAVAAASSGRENQTGLAAFLVLLGLRASAQLNLFLGVRNLSEEWMPAELLHLRRFLRRRAMNPLLPFSVAVASIAAALLAREALAETSELRIARSAVLASLAALGALEHLLLVLPFDPTRLWPDMESGPRSD